MAKYGHRTLTIGNNEKIGEKLEKEDQNGSKGLKSETERLDYGNRDRDTHNPWADDVGEGIGMKTGERTFNEEDEGRGKGKGTGR